MLAVELETLTTMMIEDFFAQSLAAWLATRSTYHRMTNLCGCTTAGKTEASGTSGRGGSGEETLELGR